MNKGIAGLSDEKTETTAPTRVTGKADLYVEGARLPEQLSRLLFLEGMVAGRRVLEVGATSSAVARFLLELGASRVVCAVDPTAGTGLLEKLRGENDLDNVDFRAIRPGTGSRPPAQASRPPAPVLPGDDGAFDLVIDFNLAQALARGENGRLTDIKRVLSEDGFALTSLSSTSTRGLSTLLEGGARAAEPQASYRGLVEALKGQFELVQVYFQSLLLGYLFGSFDVDPKDDGIAPQTSLMGHDPEPAGSYVFAFGNAVPLIEDVCLVQVPFDALLQAFLDRRAREKAATSRAENFDDHTEQITVIVAPPLRPLPSLADSDPSSEMSPSPSLLTSEVLRLEGLLVEREASLVALRSRLADAEALVVDAARTLLPAEADAEEAAAALAQAEVTQRELQSRLDDAIARVTALENALHVTRAELERATRARDDFATELRADRDGLAEQVVALDRAHVELLRSTRLLTEERDLLALRAGELEEAVLAASAERSDLQSELLSVQTLAEGERQRARLEREMLEAALQERAADDDDTSALAALEANLKADRDALQAQLAEAEEQTRTAVARLRASHDDADAALVARLRDAEAAIAPLQERIAKLEAALEEANDVIADAVNAADGAGKAVIERLQSELESAVARAQSSESRALAIDEERTTLRERVASLEGDAMRLADGVKVLIDERTVLSQQLGVVSEGSAQHELELARAKMRADDAERALDDAKAALAASESRVADDVEKLSEKRRSDQRIIEELRARLQDARAAIDDVTAQRQVVQQALAAKDAELFERRGEQQRLAAEVERRGQELVELQKNKASVDDAAAALSLEVRRLHGVVDETSQKLARITGERDEAITLASQLDDKRRAAEAEVTTALLDIESQREAERAAAKEAADVERAQLHQLFAEEKARLLQEGEAAREALIAQLTGDHATSTKAAVAEAVNAAIHDAEELLGRTLAQKTADFAEKSAALEARLNDEQAAFERRLNDEQAAFERRLEETRQALAEQATAQLNDARGMFDVEKAALSQSHSDALAAAARGRDDAVNQVEQLRASFDFERARLERDVEATRDELAHATESLLALEERAHAVAAEQQERAAALTRLEQERADLERALASSRAEHQATATRLADVEATSATAVSDLAQQLSTLSTKQAALAVEHDATTAALAALRASNDIVTADLTAARDEGAALAKDLFDLRASLRDLEEVREQQDEVLDAARTAHAAERARLEGDVARVTAERDGFKADLDVVITARDAVKADLARVKGEFDVVTAERDEARVEAAALQATAAASTSTLQSSLAATTAQLAALQSTHDALAARLQGIDDERAALAQRLSAKDAEVAALSAKLSAAEDSFVTSDDQLKTARAALDDLTQAKSREVAALEAQIDDVKVDLAETQELLLERERSLEDARTRLQAATERADDLDAQHNQARSAFDDLGMAKANEIAALQAALDESAVELTRSNELLAERERAVEDVRHKLIGAEQHARDLDAERARLELVAREAKAAADADLAALETVAREESAAAAAKSKALQQQLDGVTAERDAAFVARDAALVTAQKAAAERDAALASVQKATDELASTSTVLDQLASENDATATQLKAAHEMLRNGQRVLEETRANLAALQKRFDDVSAEHTQATALAATRAEEALALQKRVELADADRELKGAALGEARSLLDVERARGDLFRDELDEAKQTLSRERARGDLFRAELEEAQNALTLLRAQLKDADDHREEMQATLHNISSSAEGEAVRASEFETQLQEAAARAVALQARLDDAEASAAKAAARAAELSGQLDDAQQTFLLRRAAHQGDLDRLVGHRLAEKSASERAIADLKARLQAAEDAVVAASSDASAASSLVDELRGRLQVAEEAAAAGAGLDATVVELRARLQVAEDAVAVVGDLRARAAEDEATVVELRARLQVAEDAVVKASAGASASSELQARVESLLAEREGLQSALELARDDVTQLQAQQQEAALEAREQLMLVTAERDRLQDNVHVDVSARVAAEDAADAAKAALRAAEEAAAKAQESLQQLESELARVRAEAAAPAAVVDDVAALKERLEAAEKASKAKDLKIAEQAERINRLTERIVRSEGLA